MAKEKPTELFKEIYSAIAHGLSDVDVVENMSDSITLATENVISRMVFIAEKDPVEQIALEYYPVPTGCASALVRPLRVSERNAFIVGFNACKSLLTNSNSLT